MPNPPCGQPTKRQHFTAISAGLYPFHNQCKHSRIIHRSQPMIKRLKFELGSRGFLQEIYAVLNMQHATWLGIYGRVVLC